MDMVRLIALTTIAAGIAAASDFSIEIGSPAAALSAEVAARKVKNAAFSLRVRDCANAHVSGTALSETQRKQFVESLVFTPGSTAGAYVVTRTNTQAYGSWVAVITAECGGNKLGVLVPVSADGVYNRAAAKFVAHAPTPAEMEEVLRTMKGESR